MQNSYTSMKEIIPDISVGDDKSIRDVLRQIDKGALGIALLVDSDTNCFKGIITDGDIRRALIRGLDLESPLSNIARPQTITASINASSEEISKLFGEIVRVIPLLDSNNQVADLAFFDTRVYLPVSEPNLSGNELKYVNECILTGWVSSAGKYITQFEQMFADFRIFLNKFSDLVTREPFNYGPTYRDNTGRPRFSGDGRHLPEIFTGLG